MKRILNSKLTARKKRQLFKALKDASTHTSVNWNYGLSMGLTFARAPNKVWNYWRRTADIVDTGYISRTYKRYNIPNGYGAKPLGRKN